MFRRPQAPRKAMTAASAVPLVKPSAVHKVGFLMLWTEGYIMLYKDLNGFERIWCINTKSHQAWRSKLPWPNCHLPAAAVKCKQAKRLNIIKPRLAEQSPSSSSSENAHAPDHWTGCQAQWSWPMPANGSCTWVLCSPIHPSDHLQKFFQPRSQGLKKLFLLMQVHSHQRLHFPSHLGGATWVDCGWSEHTNMPPKRSAGWVACRARRFASVKLLQTNNAGGPHWLGRLGLDSTAVLSATPHFAQAKMTNLVAADDNIDNIDNSRHPDDSRCIQIQSPKPCHGSHGSHGMPWHAMPKEPKASSWSRWTASMNKSGRLHRASLKNQGSPKYLPAAIESAIWICQRAPKIRVLHAFCKSLSASASGKSTALDHALVNLAEQRPSHYNFNDTNIRK